MNKKRFQTTFAKMALCFVAFGLIPMLGLSMFFFFRYDRVIRENRIADYTRNIQYFSNNVGDIMSNVDSTLGEIYDYQNDDGETVEEILNNSGMDMNEKESKIQTALKELMHTTSYVSGLRLADSAGNTYSVHYDQGKVLRKDQSDLTDMGVFTSEDNLRALKVFGTIPESDLCVGSDDYVFVMARNYMDTSTIYQSQTHPVATIFADVDASSIASVAEKMDTGAAGYYVFSTENSACIYDSDPSDYQNGENPLSSVMQDIQSGSGYLKNGRQWIFYCPVSDMQAYCVVVVDNAVMMGSFIQTRSVLILILCFACAFLLILFLAFSVRMSEPTRKLKLAMEEVEKGNLDARVEIATHDEMQYVADGFNQMAEQLKDYINQVFVAEICQKDAELNALKMQIQPHFLYNTLDVIRMTALDQDDEKTAALIESLAHQMRYVMGDYKDHITLDKELESIREYFVLMQARYENRISLTIYVENDNLSLIIPKMLLQPVVENAIRHGLKPKTDRGSVAIRVDRREDHLEIVVMDDGVGMSAEQAQQLNDTMRNSDLRNTDEGRVSIGLKNVYDRIKLTCGMQYGFEFQSIPGMGTIVTYRLPIWETPEDIKN